MRRIAWALLVLFVFTIPWEYSLVVPAPFGNVARIAGLLALFAAIPAVIEADHLRSPALLHWLILALYLWWCCTCFWTIDTTATLTKLRGYFQEMMIAWLLWEFTESAADLRNLLRAWVAGSWVLALLTLANFASVEAAAAGQVRFAPVGQDPNDLARFLDFGLPLAALLFRSEKQRSMRWLAVPFLPVGLIAVLLTASRSGFLAAMVALIGCALVLCIGKPKVFAAGILASPAVAAGFWFAIPSHTLERLATIPAELEGGGLNQRIDIWRYGWDAFVQSPVVGMGAGTFVNSAHTAPGDTAHNALLSIAVSGGLCAVFLAASIVAAVVWLLPTIQGLLRITASTILAVLILASLVATVEESRTTWLLIGFIAVAARLAAEQPQEIAELFTPSDCFARVTAAATSIAVPK